MTPAAVRGIFSARALREDRIAEEIHATGGDMRRICDLFGLTAEAVLRCAAPSATPAWQAVMS